MTRPRVERLSRLRLRAPAALPLFVALFTFAGWARIATAETCAGGVTNYCCDGNTPTLGVCGNVGQRICLVDTPLNFSDCKTICAPGLVYNGATAHCELPCSYCTDVGFCCGDVGQTACLLGAQGPGGCGIGAINAGCKAGLHFGPSFLCEPPAVPEQTFLNGSSPRPFYIWGHNPNTFGKIDADLAAGANALEPDVTTATDGPCDAGAYGDLVDSDSSSPYRGGLCYDTHFTDWLDHVRGIVEGGNSGLALIAFDIKSSVAKGADVKRILAAIRAHLTSHVSLKIILSVGSLGDAATAFGSTDFTSADLLPGEGVMVDGDDDAAAVNAFFINHHYTDFGYGDGTAINALDVSFHGVELRAQDKAAFLRASQGSPKILAYAYLLNAKKEMNAFINAGVDGIIPGTADSAIPIPDPGCESYYGVAGSGAACDILKVLSCGKGEFCRPTFMSPTSGVCQGNVTALLACAHSPNPSASLDVSEIQILAGVVATHPEIRLAGPLDDPFMPALQSYGLKIVTGDDGTDADLTFTLTGCKASAKMTVNAGYIIDPIFNSGRMESGTVDFVTIPSADLGPLKAITIYNDGTGLNPQWNFTSLQVSSVHWRHFVGDGGVDYQVPAGTHTLPRWQSITLPLTSDSGGGAITVPTLPDVTAQCHAELPAAPTAQDGCNASLVGTTLAPPFFKQGDFTITWSFADTFGNAATANQAVHVHDTIAPVISGLPASVTVGTGPGRTTCDQVATWALPTATDNCTLVSDLGNHLPGDTFPVGTTAVSYVATDEVDNTTVASFPVIVVDDTPPIIACPGSIVVDASAASGAVIAFTATATDNCAPSPNITYSQNPGLFAIGTTTVTSTATDHARNTSACQFTVTVRGPRAIELDVLAKLQALLPGLSDKKEARSLADAIDAVIEANDTAYWIDDSHLQLKKGEHVFDQKRKAVQKLAELVRKDTALTQALQPLIAREVLACRILVEVALSSATGKSLAEAQRELAMGDQAVASGDADKAIGHYGSAWKAATR